jgi:DnaJ-class molecular chaperone
MFEHPESDNFEPELYSDGDDEDLEEFINAEDPICTACDGTGLQNGHLCKTCQGTGLS